jgi:hypothetical protein
MPRPSFAWLGLALLHGCEERSRLTFESNGPDDTTGPVATIDEPASDTLIFAGAPFILGGRVVDPGGVDTVYVDIEGSDHSLLPLAGGGRDTVRFGVPITTLGQAGRTVTVQVFGVDLFGNRGDRVLRQFLIR